METTAAPVAGAASAPATLPTRNTPPLGVVSGRTGAGQCGGTGAAQLPPAGSTHEGGTQARRGVRGEKLLRLRSASTASLNRMKGPLWSWSMTRCRKSSEAWTPSPVSLASSMVSGGASAMCRIVGARSEQGVLVCGCRSRPGPAVRPVGPNWTAGPDRPGRGARGLSLSLAPCVYPTSLRQSVGPRPRPLPSR